MFTTKKPLLMQLKSQGLEFDQKLTRALEISASKPNLEPEDKGFPDSYLTLALYRLNTTLTRIVKLDEKRLNIFHEYKKAPRCNPSEVIPGKRLCLVLTEAAKLAEPRNTIGSGHFLRAIASVTKKYPAIPADGFKDQVLHSTFSIETLMWGVGYNAWTPLSKAPKVKELFSIIESKEPTEDFPYLMALENEQLIFRPTSILNPYLLSEQGGVQRPELAVLTHFREQYACVTPSELMELEELINNPKAKEEAIQKFFENHPQFFRRWDYRDIYPHIFLTREDVGPLIPDFILIDPDAQRTTVVDLKLPKTRLIRRQNNRDRFSSSVIEARAQLLEYRDWFEKKTNRDQLKERLGIEVYRPHMGVVIGTSKEFRDAFDRQKLVSTMPDIDIVTYDDILASAKKRLAIIKSA